MPQRRGQQAHRRGAGHHRGLAINKIGVEGIFQPHEHRKLQVLVVSPCSGRHACVRGRWVFLPGPRAAGVASGRELRAGRGRGTEAGKRTLVSARFTARTRSSTLTPPPRQPSCRSENSEPRGGGGHLTADMPMQGCSDMPNWIKGHATGVEHAMVLLCRRCAAPAVLRADRNLYLIELHQWKRSKIHMGIGSHITSLVCKSQMAKKCRNSRRRGGAHRCFCSGRAAERPARMPWRQSRQAMLRGAASASYILAG